jgi:hypothetical protein
MSSFYFDKKDNHFTGKKLEWPRFKDEVATAIYSELGSEWADDYLFKKHKDDICEDRRFIRLKVEEILLEGDIIQKNGRDHEITHNEALINRENRKEVLRHNSEVSDAVLG